MRIVILKGSPNIEGSSNMLAKNFSKGAIEAGHEVKEVDVAHANISPCIGCVHCGYEGGCVLNDDMDEIRNDILTTLLLSVSGMAGISIFDKGGKNETNNDNSTDGESQD